MNETQIILKSGKADSVRRRHPWIFSGAIKKVIGHPQEGDVVRVTDNKDEFLAYGHYQNGSIAVRIFSFKAQKPDAGLWRDRLLSAYRLRVSLGLIGSEHTDAYRLVFAEGDMLPGLVVDVYGSTAVLQVHSIGMHHIRHQLAEILKDLYGARLDTIYYKCEDSLPKNTTFEKKDEFLLGNKEEDVVLENKQRFYVNWVQGQKTGFFLDQRDNRRLVRHYARGRKVLNTYCYTGGFSVYALSAGASLVHSVDSSKKAIELTDRNISMMEAGSEHRSFAVEAMGFLNEMDEDYDLIILDPPAFAKHRDVKHRAVQGYKRINARAMEKIAKGGILFTFSCSQVIDARLFENTIHSAAIVAGRNIRVLHHLSQGADHPYSVFHPEGRYLKGLVLYVE